MSVTADVEENAIGIVDAKLEMARDWGESCGLYLEMVELRLNVPRPAADPCYKACGLAWLELGPLFAVHGWPIDRITSAATIAPWWLSFSLWSLATDAFP